MVYFRVEKKGLTGDVEKRGRTTEGRGHSIPYSPWRKENRWEED